jgi:coproporphyrinogen III oxidase-like Fe-S oxidoreductase
MFSFLATIPPGRFAFEMGIQSTNEATLSAINRRIEMTRVAENIRRLQEIDTVHLHSDLILGLPFETAETFHKTFNDVFAFGSHHIQMGLLKILPGTPISDEQTWGFGALR